MAGPTVYQRRQQFATLGATTVASVIRDVSASSLAPLTGSTGATNTPSTTNTPTGSSAPPLADVPTLGTVGQGSGAGATPPPASNPSTTPVSVTDGRLAGPPPEAQPLPWYSNPAYQKTGMIVGGAFVAGLVVGILAGSRGD